MPSNLSIQNTILATHYHPMLPSDVARSPAMSGLLVILIPAIVIGAIVGRRQYRATVRQQRIQRLNRLWQLDCIKKLS